MNKNLFLVVLSAVFGLGGTVASADSGQQYLLPKIGIMDISANDADLLYSLGLQYGIGLTRDAALELDLNYGFLGGEYKTQQEHGDYRVFEMGAYGVYRLALGKTFYLKGKLGGVYEDVERSSNVKAGSKEDMSLAGGLGAGYYFGEVGPTRLTLELEWTKFEKDINFYSLGAHFAF